MDYESEKLLKFIFPKDYEELTNHEDPTTTTEVLEYLLKLGTYKAEELKKERVRLQDEHRQNVEQTQELAIAHYPIFIRTAESSREIYRQFTGTERKLDCLDEKWPRFITACQAFLQGSGEINTARRLNSLTLRRNAELLEILELPQLMDSCIREGKYEEALELSAYVQRLASKHGNIPVIASISEAVEGAWHTMLMQLLGQLRTDLQLPKCLQVVGYLRRMQAFSPAELKLKFLQIRTGWLRELLVAIPTDDAQQHLTKTIEVTRVQLFNIITQYRAIFPDDDIGGEPAPVPTLSNDILDLRGGPMVCDERKVFHSWLLDQIGEFVKTLEQDLTSGDIGTFDTILGQCMYFGLSFSRVGIDFRALVAPVFVRVIGGRFRSSVARITSQFVADIERYTLINRVPSMIRRSATTLPVDEVSGVHPPETLLDFEPLAVYCNALLVVFNELRLCSPMALATTVSSVLEESLERVARSILDLYRQEQQAFSPTERECFVRLCTCFAYDLVPYLQRCIHVIFPPALLASQLGINVLTLQKHGLTYLAQTRILQPIAYLLPDRIDTTIKQQQQQQQQQQQLEQPRASDIAATKETDDSTEVTDKMKTLQVAEPGTEDSPKEKDASELVDAS
ncbi:conserved oligomeric Golgi complex subunit 8-like [Anopheles albimanus]|uniref:Conserved oligomeric Golgi complex subunit 8 n=1 Tax=Anopheles albimanus TaxID=7167 RepID=A0A182FKQ1_ANOAL|nr:conserved oligomeric Golgi complex subunit 8-like [Anopheles albimanus]